MVSARASACMSAVSMSAHRWCRVVHAPTACVLRPRESLGDDVHTWFIFNDRINVLGLIKPVLC